VDLRIFDPKVSHENLWLDSDLYDCFFVIGYNDNPIIPQKGSAIFLHIARAGYTGTAGCVAFAKPDLWIILEAIKFDTKIIINAPSLEDLSHK
jgi:L,D-peptidoglycan transpeptidase YkuD (ErfK/YbiS/YcfS/YnhG family)